MTTQLFPPILASPFEQSFECNSTVFRNAATSNNFTSHLFSSSFTPIAPFRSQQTTPGSILSTVSAPVVKNNENSFPLQEKQCNSIIKPRRSFSDSQTWNQTGFATNSRISKATFGLPQKQCYTEVGLKALKGQKCQKRIHSEGEDKLSCHNRLRHQVDPAEEGKLWNSTTESRQDFDVSSKDIPKYELQTPTGKFQQTQKTQQPSGRGNAQLFFASENEDNNVTPRKRASTSSSRVIHTVRTASMSNTSMSLIPKSYRLGRSSETLGVLDSQARYSLDSERPRTASPVEKAVQVRASKRRQILEELVQTEESYVGDLKALVYLMSTLLISTTTVSNHLRAAIERNAGDLLHMHEQLLEEFHRETFAAAARRWSHAISPRRTGLSQHTRWHSLNSQELSKRARAHRKTRSSVDTADLSRVRAVLGSADPADVSAMLAIFQKATVKFSAYEEYCANRELIADELQKQLPTLWSTYDSGMESLARSLVSLDQRHQSEKKCLTVGDLLIKPIQRLCKYPLLLEDLLRHTPVSDCPDAHAMIEVTLQQSRKAVQAVNEATNNPETRIQVQRRWLLQAHLQFDKVKIQPHQLRSLGKIILCGVLFATHQGRVKVDGQYSLCVLFETAFLMAAPANASNMFDVIALIDLADLSVESASDSKGLQCHSALHTWKVSFVFEFHIYELMLSACSAFEEHQWKRGLRGGFVDESSRNLLKPIATSIGVDLKSIGRLFTPHNTLSRESSVQRAATVGKTANISQVIVRNTHSPQDLNEFRHLSSSVINRSQSHMTSHRIVVLAPKRSERAKLESSLADVWTRDKLPYPGMIASRGGLIIRASAGSLVRKLSLASIHSTFSKRSASHTGSSGRSYDAIQDPARFRDMTARPRFEVRRNSLVDGAVPTTRHQPSHDLPELDTMDRVVTRMIGDAKPNGRSGASPHVEGLRRRFTRSGKGESSVVGQVGPDDSAETFYRVDSRQEEKETIVEEHLAGKKKRRSNPMDLLKEMSVETIKHMIHSSK